MVLIKVAEFIGKIWFKLTASFPRRLPTTPAQYDQLKNILLHVFRVPDHASTWLTVAGQIASTPGTKMRKPLSQIVNAVQRLKVNQIAAAHRSEANKVFEKDLEDAFERAKAQAEAEQKVSVVLRGADDQEAEKEQPPAPPES